jgi:hypothetical protein
MNREEGADDSPRLGELKPLEPEENDPDKKRSSSTLVQAHPSEDPQAIETFWDGASLPKSRKVASPRPGRPNEAAVE